MGGLTLQPRDPVPARTTRRAANTDAAYEGACVAARLTSVRAELYEVPCLPTAVCLGSDVFVSYICSLLLLVSDVVSDVSLVPQGPLPARHDGAVLVQHLFVVFVEGRDGQRDGQLQGRRKALGLLEPAHASTVSVVSAISGMGVVGKDRAGTTDETDPTHGGGCGREEQRVRCAPLRDMKHVRVHADGAERRHILLLILTYCYCCCCCC
mmetsp:Transcript_5593/g.12292  ORF Transcript_5593/g.12292 Transcript_5593/m.12292 type:complete len:210 (-) Transcript_5593:8-637(-)